MGGNIDVLKFFVSKEFDIKSEINNGLNVFYIVFIYNYIEMCKYFIKGEEIKILIDKVDVYGWNIVYFLVMVGDNGIFDLIKSVSNVKIY